MKNNQINYFLIFFCCVNAFVFAQNDSLSRYTGINVGSETRTLLSKINKKDYKLYINLPQGYTENTEKKYPVLYQLDGQWDFVSIVSIYGSVHWDGFLPDMIIVGITYAGDNPDYEGLRANDFTPTKFSQVKNSGGAELFTNVLEKEIMPFVEREYRAEKTNRSLVGTSFGGLYTHYVLFNAPDLFNNYIICNPSLWWDNKYPFKYEKQFSKKHSSLNANVYIVSGSLDAVEAHNKMVTQIESRNYENLNLESSILEGMAHSGSKFEGYARGMLHVYKIKGMKLSDVELKKYTGKYKMVGGNDSVEIIINNEHLAFKSFNGRSKVPVYAINKTKFSVERSYKYVFDFEKTKNEKITGFKANISGNNIVFEKVD